MPSSPAFQFYPDDFLGSGTVGMGTLEEIGAYTLLLCLDWNSNGFPLNFDRLARWCKITPRKFKHLWGYLEGHFPKCEDGMHRNPRLQIERVKQAEYSHAMSENGKKGGRPKKPAAFPQESNGLAAVKPNGKPPESIPSPTPFPLTTEDQLLPPDGGFGASPNGHPDVLDAQPKPPNGKPTAVPKKRGGGKTDVLGIEACNALYEKWTAVLGGIEYGRFRKAMLTVFRGKGADPTLDQMLEAIQAFGEWREGLSPKEAGWQTVERFTQDIRRWVDLGALPLVDGFGILTERGHLVVTGGGR